MIHPRIKKIILLLFPSVIKHRMFAHYKQLNWKTLSVLEFDAELLVLDFLLTKDSVFFDVGANKGEYTYYAQNLALPNNCFVFEPEKNLYYLLSKLFKKCNVFDIALSDKKGTYQFKTPLINGVADNCLSSLEINNIEDNETQALITTVKTDTLDEFVKKNNVTPTVIKIDVEGHELAVLKGAEQTIAKHKPTLIIEIEQRHHKHNDINTVFYNFKNKGYNCHYYSKPMRQLCSFDDKVNLTNTKEYFGKINYINNYIFIHSSNTQIKSIDAINKIISQNMTL